MKKVESDKFILVGACIGAFEIKIIKLRSWTFLKRGDKRKKGEITNYNLPVLIEKRNFSLSQALLD